MTYDDIKNAVVYRFYDADGAALYIGYSSALLTRITGHRSNSPWFKKVATVKVEHFDTRSAALAAEKVAIEAERPRYNINHKAGSPRGSWWALTHDRLDPEEVA